MFESESDFVDCFIESVAPSIWCRSFHRGHVRTTFESDCSDGRADWVWASSAGRWPNSWCDTTAEVLQNPTCSRILAYLKLLSPRTECFLRDRLGVSGVTFGRAVRDLKDVRLIRKTCDELYLLTPKLSLPEVEICAFEFKLEDWKRAFFQATRYRSFAHRVYVVLPSTTIKRTERLWNSFRRQSIGLISFDRDTGARRVLSSNKNSPRSKSSFYQALGMLHQWG